VSRFLIVIAGLALFACTVAASIRLEVPRIEADLETRTRAAAQKAGFDWLDVRATGQTLELSGNAPNYTDRNEAEALVRSVWGVAAIDNRIVLVGNGDSCREELEVFEAADPVRFAPGSMQLDDNAERLLGRLAALARNCDANLVVALAARPGTPSKRELDRARLEAVQRYLHGSGVPPRQLVGGNANPERVDAKTKQRRHVEIWVMEDAT
jgi:hypothetical protein